MHVTLKHFNIKTHLFTHIQKKSCLLLTHTSKPKNVLIKKQSTGIKEKKNTETDDILNF